MSSPSPAVTDPPGWQDPIVRALEEIRSELATRDDGAVADYIPQLSVADPAWFGLALSSLDGHLYRAGDADVPFTIQSISKPFVLALALADLGPGAVAERVGSEPSGEAFNAISLEPGSGRPENPMVNAGAIVTSSLVRATGSTERFERIRQCLSAFAGRTLDVDAATFESERTTGDRNRALAYLMRNAGSLKGDIDEVLDVYFQQCSLLVTAADLAVMAATLGNGGINPVTGVEVIDRDITAHVLTVMATCGMYDYAGEWLLRVGLPAKSGVSGGVVAVGPGQFGIGLFSPPLDPFGNSVRGVEASQVISDRFGLHMMRVPTRPARPVYLHATGDTFHSTRVRRREERAALAGGRSIVVRGIGGDIEFAEAEILVHSLAETAGTDPPRWSVIDLHRVTRVHQAAREIFRGLIADILGRGVTVAVADPGGWIDPAQPVERFPTLDLALEWCEDQLLAELDPALGPDGGVALADHVVLTSLDPDMAGLVLQALDTRWLEEGDDALPDDADLAVLVLTGRLAVSRSGPGQAEPVRVESMGPGTALSRLRLVNRVGGTNRLLVERPGEVAVLRADRLDALELEHPGITGRLWESLTEWAGQDPTP
jgi:glutaminase